MSSLAVVKWQDRCFNSMCTVRIHSWVAPGRALGAKQWYTNELVECRRGWQRRQWRRHSEWQRRCASRIWSLNSVSLASPCMHCVSAFSCFLYRRTLANIPHCSTWKECGSRGCFGPGIEIILQLRRRCFLNSGLYQFRRCAGDGGVGADAGDGGDTENGDGGTGGVVKMAGSTTQTSSVPNRMQNTCLQVM